MARPSGPHTHKVEDIDGLPEALDGKMNVETVYTKAEVDALLENKSDVHDHPYAPVDHEHESVDPPTDPPVYGASNPGPTAEPAHTDGDLLSVYPDDINNATNKIRVPAGSYNGSCTIPPGVVVVPDEGAVVTINGSVYLGSGASIRGMTVMAASSWVIRLKATTTPITDAVIANCDISGGTIEAIRFSQNVQNVRVDGCVVRSDGNHGIKFHSEGSSYHPSGSVINCLIKPPANEDGIQIESGGNVLIDRVTFMGAPEDNLDIKNGTVEVRNSLFHPANQGQVLAHHQADAWVHDSRFIGRIISCGSKGVDYPTLNLDSNRLENCDVWFRQSLNPIMQNNIMTGGVLKVGFPDGDIPEGLRVIINTFDGVDLVDRTPIWEFTGNTVLNPVGMWP